MANNIVLLIFPHDLVFVKKGTNCGRRKGTERALERKYHGNRMMKNKSFLFDRQTTWRDGLMEAEAHLNCSLYKSFRKLDFHLKNFCDLHISFFPSTDERLNQKFAWIHKITRENFFPSIKIMKKTNSYKFIFPVKAFKFEKESNKNYFLIPHVNGSENNFCSRCELLC